MYFIYLPTLTEASTGTELKDYLWFPREFVMSATTKLRIPFIDIQKQVFEHHHDPLSLFPFRRNSHYTAEGYQLVGDTIGNRLKSDGIIPSNSRN